MKAALAVAVAVLAAVILLRALAVPDQQQFPFACHKEEWSFVKTSQEVVQRLTSALRYKTVSTAPGQYDRSELTAFRVFLEHSFPNLFDEAQRPPEVSYELVNDYSMLLHWKGTDSSLEPAMFAAHLDVVPVSDASQWTEPPFEGHIHQKKWIWGRGSLDFKQGVLGLLEAMSHLVSKGHAPKRSLYLAFGHDEEVGGNDGAREIAKLLLSRGERMAFILDEGMIIGLDAIPGVDRPVALVGVSEKGAINVRLSVNLTDGGHSSVPPPQSAIGILSEAISKVERNPMTSHFSNTITAHLFEAVVKHMDWPKRVLMSNAWLFEPLIRKAFAMKPSTNALIRTTNAVTMVQGGVKVNVLPRYASAVVNNRVHPSDSLDDVLQHMRRVIDDDRVEVEKETDYFPSFPAAPVTPHNVFTDAPYATVAKSVRQVFPDVWVAPTIFIANSDTRHYWQLTEHIFRFCPSELVVADVRRIHGVDERLAIDNYGRIINFYAHMMINADSMHTLSASAHDDREL